MAYKPLEKTLNFLRDNNDLSSLFKFNDFSHEVEYNRSPPWNESIKVSTPITDETITNVRKICSLYGNFEPSRSILGEAIYLEACLIKYHPVKRFIQKEIWDKIERLDLWLTRTTSCPDNIYTRQVSKNIILAAVNRVFRPGCKFDHMVILEGKQGLGKSTLIEKLAGDFYLDTSFDIKANDLVDSISRALIVEISELAGMGKKEIQWIRRFITCKVDRVRLPYVHRVQDFPRACVLIGTHNPSGDNTYLKDDTGNRRFWPIECRKIDLEYISSNINQIWAEAYERYKSGDQYHITNQEALNILQSLHADREYDDPNIDIIEKWLKLQPKQSATMDEIISDGLKIDRTRISRNDYFSYTSRIGHAMKKLGWVSGNGKFKRTYFPPDDFYSKQVEGISFDD